MTSPDPTGAAPLGAAPLGADPLLSDVFTIPEVVSASDFVLQLHTGVDHAQQTVADYVATESLAHAFDLALGFLGSAMAGNKAQGVFLHGAFGSGKSHFMAVLDLMLRGDPAARAVPGLQQVVAWHAPVLGRRLLTSEYHLIGASSLEQAVFGGFTERVAALHPEATPPLLHKSDQLFADAADRRAANEADFFARLNSSADAGAGSGSGGGGWGSYGSGWDAASFDRAVAAPHDDEDRARLVADLVRTMFTGFAAAGEWLDVADGLAVMARTTRDLGYDGLVLFLDELVLWLASHASDAAFVSSEASKVAKLVESGVGTRAVPMVSFVARQRELADFVGDKAAGVQRASVGQTIQYWEDRFDTITLSASNLPDVAHCRLLTARSPEAAAVVASAVAAVKATAAWDVLMQDAAGSDEAAFAKVYPFSPALVDVLVALSGRLQRERTALKVMAQLLSRRRDTGRVRQVIGVGELYDVMVASGEQPLSEDMRQLFTVARGLYDGKLRPLLMERHQVAPDADTDTLPGDHAFARNARLAKTLLVAALVPEVPSLSRLTATRLAALNHGTVQAWIPGEEGTQVLQEVRAWAQRLGEVHISEGPDPAISVTLAGVDYDSVTARVESEDTPGRRRALLRRLLFDDLGVPEPAQLAFGSPAVERVWRGTKRSVDVVFGNIRDETALPDATLLADGDQWKLVVDYPFDEGDHGPQEDVNRLDQLRIDGTRSRTVAWVPYFLTAARQRDLGLLVQLEHLLGGTGAHFDANAAHLPVDQRPLARQQLENQRRALTERLKDTLRQAYGIASPQAVDVDTATFGEVILLPTLWRDEPLRRPAGGTLASALTGIVDQVLTLQYPEHPVFENGDAEIRRAELGHVWDVITRAAGRPHGRLDPLEQNRRSVMRRVAVPLGLGFMGDAHYVFNAANVPWVNRFVQRAAAEGLGSEIPVATMREWLAPYGLTREMANLVVAAFALLQDKQYRRHGALVPVDGPAAITDDLVLVDPRLPGEAEWQLARRRAADLFGIQSAQRRTAVNVSALARDLATAVAQRRRPAQDLVAVLDAHAATLGLGPAAPRLVTARTAGALLGALAGAGDDVGTVDALAQLAVPDEPQALATSMASAGEVLAAVRQRDWTALDGVAGVAARGDESAAAVLSTLRERAAADELHAPLGPALAAGAAKATQWLLASRGQAGDGTGARPGAATAEPGAGPGGEPGRGTSGDDGRAPTLTDPDGVDLAGLDAKLTAVTAEIRASLAANPGRRVVITWHLR